MTRVAGWMVGMITALGKISNVRWSVGWVSVLDS